MSTTSRCLRRRRQAVGDPQINQPRFLASGHDFNRETECGFKSGHELAGVLCHAQGVGTDRAHRAWRQSAQALAEAFQAFDRTRLRRVVEVLVGGQAGSKPHRLTQRIEGIDLVIDDASDLKPKRVGSEVDRRNGRGRFHHDHFASKQPRFGQEDSLMRTPAQAPLSRVRLSLSP